MSILSQKTSFHCLNSKNILQYFSRENKNNEKIQVTMINFKIINQLVSTHFLVQIDTTFLRVQIDTS